jgi:ribulose-5-phosphate 4-epimerase/fuculose-1-phosphate aldolase
MAVSLSSACLAIALADERGTLRMIERTSRFGDTFIALADDHGTIEIADTMADAAARVEALRKRAA